jgi:hypothetical protein
MLRWPYALAGPLVPARRLYLLGHLPSLTSPSILLALMVLLDPTEVYQTLWTSEINGKLLL